MPNLQTASPMPLSARVWRSVSSLYEGEGFQSRSRRTRGRAGVSGSAAVGGVRLGREAVVGAGLGGVGRVALVAGSAADVAGAVGVAGGVAELGNVAGGAAALGLRGNALGAVGTAGRVAVVAAEGARAGNAERVAVGGSSRALGAADGVCEDSESSA